MPGRAARLQPFTQSKLLTRHFLSQHACVPAHVRTWPSAIKPGTEFCRRPLVPFRKPPACAGRLPTRGKPFCNWVWLPKRRVISAPRYRRRVVFSTEGDWKAAYIQAIGRAAVPVRRWTTERCEAEWREKANVSDKGGKVGLCLLDSDKVSDGSCKEEIWAKWNVETFCRLWYIDIH